MTLEQRIAGLFGLDDELADHPNALVEDPRTELNDLPGADADRGTRPGGIDGMIGSKGDANMKTPLWTTDKETLHDK